MPTPSLRPVAHSRSACGLSRALRSVFAASLALVAACLAVGPARAVTIDWVTVGDPGNSGQTWTYAGGPRTFGAVDYAYRIAKYEVTIGQYTEFLNAADPAGANQYGLYCTLNNYMETFGNTAGISYSAGAASGQKYSPIGSVNRPITWVSWFDAARFANWMHNGQGSGSTETGAYTLNGAVSGTAPTKNPGALFYIPTENEWYKAAYYSPLLNSGSGGYYTHATQSNTDPGNVIGGGINQANYLYNNNVFAVTQSSNYSSSQNYLTSVGAFTNSSSYYGTFDQNGNVSEWNDLAGVPGSERGITGGSWYSGSFYISSIWMSSNFTSHESYEYGFRLASPIASVPEPGTWALAIAGLAGVAVTMRRQARRCRRSTS